MLGTSRVWEIRVLITITKGTHPPLSIFHISSIHPNLSGRMNENRRIYALTKPRNIQQDPPLTKTYFDPETFLNPIAAQITSSVLGPKPRLSFISANASLPSSPPTRQPVHSDADFAHPSSPFALVINIPLITMTPENGSTELWLGTHSISSKDCQEGDHGERASGRVKADLLEERREVRAPCQPVVKKGSVVVRDLRLWHAGMPNLGAEGEVRVMLSLIHFAGWYRYVVPSFRLI
jgi:hypothetical protein